MNEYLAWLIYQRKKIFISSEMMKSGATCGWKENTGRWTTPATNSQRKHNRQ